MSAFVSFISFICNALAILIFIRAILSWFAIPPHSPINVFLYRVTEPILAPLRRVIPRFGMLDITPAVAIIVLLLIPRFIARLI